MDATYVSLLCARAPRAAQALAPRIRPFLTEMPLPSTNIFDNALNTLTESTDITGAFPAGAMFLACLCVAMFFKAFFLSWPGLVQICL